MSGIAQRHVLMLASAIRLGLECLDATAVIGHVRAVRRAKAESCLRPLAPRSVLKRMGWLCRVILWHESRLMQSLSTAQRAPTGQTRPRNRNACRTANDRRGDLVHAS